MMKKKINRLIIPLIGIMLAGVLIACDNLNSGGETALTISLNGGEGRSAMPWPPDETGILGDLNYEITLTGNGQTINRTGKGGDTIRVTVSVGLWNVAIKAFYQGNLYATGSNSVDVKSGSNNMCHVTMNKAFDDPVPGTYTVTFNSNGGTVVANQTVTEGGKATAPTAPTKAGYAFDNWYLGTSATPFNFSTPITGDITLNAKWIFNNSLNEDDLGPGGGKIFYVSSTGFTVQMVNPADNYTAHYLEVTSADVTGTTFAWVSAAHASTDISGTGTALGTGRKNTALILATDPTAPAANACVNYGTPGDWFLPSLGELELLFDSGVIISSNYYWSSSQSNSSNALFIDLSSGATGDNGKTASYNVRAIRAF